MSTGGRHPIAGSSSADAPAFSGGAIQAVILDLDGTLYRAGPVRRAMARRLAWHLVAHPSTGFRTVRLLRAYRRAQERLRASGRDGCAGDQLGEACRATGDDLAWAAEAVRRWMEVAPLPIVGRAMRPDLVAFLDAADRRGIPLGVFSDYPAEAKLDAMRIRARFRAVRCAQERDIGIFKPHPRGLLATAQALGADPGSTLYVGDRAAVDAAAAHAAGMHSALIGVPAGSIAAGSLCAGSFTELATRLGWASPS